MQKNKLKNSNSMRFRRFSHASFAVFRSLNVPVTIGVLAFSMLTFASPETVAAQTTGKQTDKQVELDEVEILGSRVPLTVSQAARIVTVIDHKEIAAAPVRTVNDLLKYAVGVDVRQRGDMGIQTDISIRGGTSDQISILLNGINISDPQTGHNAVDFPIDISQIERIEVLEGPAGRVYGTSSLLGAINIVTRTAAQNEIKVHASGGSYDYAQAGAGINLYKNKLFTNLSGNYSRSDGYTRNSKGGLNSDFKVGKVFYEGKYQASDNVKLNWFAGYSQKDFGANTFYSAAYDDQFEQTKKIFTAAQAETKIDFFRLKAGAYWNRAYDRFDFFGRGQVLNLHRSDITGVNLNGYFTTLLGKTAVGAEIRNEGIVSTNLGEPLHTTIPVSGYDKVYAKGMNRTILNGFFEHNIVFNRFTLSAGLVLAKNTWDEKGWGIYPGVDVSYRVSDALKFFASYNTSLRNPSFTELYYTVRDKVTNADGQTVTVAYQADKYLKPEEMRAAEIGVNYFTAPIQAGLTVYHHDGHNLIDWIKDTSKGSNAPWQSVNHARIKSVGVEAHLAANFFEILPSQHFFRLVDLRYNYINQDKETTPQLQSKYALNHLRHKVVAQLGFRLFSQLEWNIFYRWQDRAGNYTDKGGKLQAYRPYSLVDTRLTWQATRYQIYGEVNNLFNQTYYDYGDVPQPGCWFRLGASYRFGL